MDTLIAEPKTSVLFQNDFIKIQISQQLSLLTIEWLRQINFQERVIGYEAAFKFLKEFRVENVLLNNEKIYLFTTLEKAWVADSLKGLAEEIEVKKVALVTSDLYKNMADLSDYIDTVKKSHIDLEIIQHEFFMDSESAKLWFKCKEYLLS